MGKYRIKNIAQSGNFCWDNETDAGYLMVFEGAVYGMVVSDLPLKGFNLGMNGLDMGGCSG